MPLEAESPETGNVSTKHVVPQSHDEHDEDCKVQKRRDEDEPSLNRSVT
jgi:hypothetical protein